MKTVTKKEVSKRVAKKLGQKIYVTEDFVNAVFESLREILSGANPEIRIEIRDFGVFEIKKEITSFGVALACCNPVQL